MISFIEKIDNNTYIVSDDKNKYEINVDCLNLLYAFNIIKRSLNDYSLLKAKTIYYKYNVNIKGAGGFSKQIKDLETEVFLDYRLIMSGKALNNNMLFTYQALSKLEYTDKEHSWIDIAVFNDYNNKVNKILYDSLFIKAKETGYKLFSANTIGIFVELLDEDIKDFEVEYEKFLNLYNSKSFISKSDNLPERFILTDIGNGLLLSYKLLSGLKINLQYLLPTGNNTYRSVRDKDGYSPIFDGDRYIRLISNEVI